MDARHKNKAIIGVAIWFAAIPLVVLAWSVANKHFSPADKDTLKMARGIILAAFFAVQYFCYFWGGSHLARAKGHSNGLIILGIFWPAQIVVLSLLLFALPDNCSRHSGQKTKRKNVEDESQISRIVRYRRNALAANAVGLFGILIALGCILLGSVFFERRDNALLASVLIFVPSYAAVIYGGWWWTRAKNWPDIVIIIGLLPLVVLFIPAVNSVFRLDPMLFPVGMVVMPIILLGVIAVLPDKSGMPKRKRWDRD